MSMADHYPAMDADSCHSVGMGGGCGFECPVYQDGRCEVYNEMVDRITTIEQLEEHEEIYGQVDLATAINLKLTEGVECHGK